MRENKLLHRAGFALVTQSDLRGDSKISRSVVNSIATIIAQTPRLHLMTCISPPPLLAMAPKQHRRRAIPKAKRSFTGDTRCLRDSDADASPGESESTCMIVCSQLGFGMVGVPASAADFAKFEEYLDIGELGFVLLLLCVVFLCYLVKFH